MAQKRKRGGKAKATKAGARRGARRKPVRKAAARKAGGAAAALRKRIDELEAENRQLRAELTALREAEREPSPTADAEQPALKF